MTDYYRVFEKMGWRYDPDYEGIGIFVHEDGSTRTNEFDPENNADDFRSLIQYLEEKNGTIHTD